MISKAGLWIVVAAIGLTGCDADRDRAGTHEDGLGTAGPAELAPGSTDPGLAPGGPGATGMPGSMAPDGTMPQDTLGQDLGDPYPPGTPPQRP